MSRSRLLLALMAAATPGALIAVDRVAPRAAPAAGPVKHGVDSWHTGNYDAAVAAWRGPADAGDADAQFNLAQAYKLGRGVPQDLKAAEGWYRKAAVQGHDQAQATLGLLMFQNGDRAGALPWLQQAADKGEPRALYVYGTALFNGDLVVKDWPRAYAMMTRAAAAGLPQAKTSLAQMDQFVPMAQRQQGTALAATRYAAAASAAPSPSAPPAPASPTAPAPPIATRAAPAPIRTAPLPPSHAPESTYATEAAAPPPSASPTPAPPPHAPPAPTPAQHMRFAPPPRPAPPPHAEAPPPPAPRAKPPAPVRAAAPAPAQGGGWRIQLGAFGTQGAAETQWRTLTGRAASLRRLQPVYVKAGAVTRLQAGPFPSRAAASEACRSVGTTCFAVAS